VVVLAAGSSWWSANPVQAAPQAKTGGGSASTCSHLVITCQAISRQSEQATLDALLVADVPCVKCAEGCSSVSTTGDNSTLWGRFVVFTDHAGNPGWSPTDDLLQAGAQTSAPAFGSHYYPTECQAVKNYKNYGVVANLNKVADNIFEATVKNLFGHPAIATNGKFLRYEILIGPITSTQSCRTSGTCSRFSTT